MTARADIHGSDKASNFPEETPMRCSPALPRAQSKSVEKRSTQGSPAADGHRQVPPSCSPTVFIGPGNFEAHRFPI